MILRNFRKINLQNQELSENISNNDLENVVKTTIPNNYKYTIVWGEKVRIIQNLDEGNETMSKKYREELKKYDYAPGCKCFTQFNFHCNHMRQVLLSSTPFYRQENWDSEKLNTCLGSHSKNMVGKRFKFTKSGSIIHALTINQVLQKN